jgi:putative transposase
MLDWLLTEHGKPLLIISANGTSSRLTQCSPRSTSSNGTTSRSAPQQSGFTQSFNGKLRDECLNEQALSSLAEARPIIEGWRGLQHSATKFEPRLPNIGRLRGELARCAR